MTFSDFTSICDRNYFLSYLTPSLVFILANLFLVIIFPQVFVQSLIYSNLLESSTGSDNLLIVFYNMSQNLWVKDVIILTLLLWILSVILMVVNLPLVQFLEGYGLLQRTRLLKYKQEDFDEISGKIVNIKNVIDEYNKGTQKTREKLIELIHKYEIEDKDLKDKDLKKLETQQILSELRRKRTRLLYRFGLKFPPDRHHVLPTSFGNVIRAFETYSYEVYGIDAIAVWSRIIQLSSNDHKKSISDAKAQVDFSVNLYYVLIIVIIEYSLLSVVTRSTPSILFPLTLFFFAWLSYKMAVTSAVGWGEEVKTIFDLYRYDLLMKMEISDISEINEKQKWKEISRRFIYWNNRGKRK